MRNTALQNPSRSSSNPSSSRWSKKYSKLTKISRFIGNLIESQFISIGDWNFGSAISLVLAVIILGAIKLMKKIDPDKE
jgi:hypothetical protein